MTTGLDSFLNRLNARAEVIQSGAALEIAVRTTEAAKVQRIFGDGLNSSNAKIGSYNTTTPIYASDKQLPKAGTHKGKRGKKTKTSYYSSYNELRKQQGRPQPNVVPFLTGDLMSDYANSPGTTAGSVITNPIPIKVDNQTYKVTLNRQNNIDKRQGLEKKYGTIFNNTDQEKSLFIKTLQFEISRLAKDKA